MLVRNCDSHADSEHGLRCSGIEVLRRRGARDYRGRTVARGLTPVKRLQCCHELDVQIERKHLYASLRIQQILLTVTTSRMSVCSQ